MLPQLPICWITDPPDFSWPGSKLYICLAKLNALVPLLPYLHNLLHPTELIRADQFVFTRDRERFIAARGFLRFLLGKYLNISGVEVEFIYLPQGKPHLKEEQNTRNLHFNLSHAQDHILIALRQNYAVGVDVEYMRSAEILSLAKNYFSLLEYQELAKLASDKQRELFFQLWTRKEAVLKTSGKGLSHSLAEVEVLGNNPIITNLGVFFIASLPMSDCYQAAISSSEPFGNAEVYCWEATSLFLQKSLHL